jgi:SnoaL-like polyketide cyclase
VPSQVALTRSTARPHDERPTGPGVNGHREIDDIFSADDKVVVRWTGTGEHVAELNGIPPTGRKIDVSAISIHRMNAGTIAETWGDPTADEERSEVTKWVLLDHISRPRFPGRVPSSIGRRCRVGFP